MHYNELPFLSLSQEEEENHQRVQPTLSSGVVATDTVYGLNPSSRAAFCICRKTTPFLLLSEVDSSQAIRGLAKMENHA